MEWKSLQSERFAEMVKTNAEINAKDDVLKIKTEPEFEQVESDTARLVEREYCQTGMKRELESDLDNPFVYFPAESESAISLDDANYQHETTNNAGFSNKRIKLQQQELAQNFQEFEITQETYNKDEDNKDEDNEDIDAELRDESQNQVHLLQHVNPDGETVNTNSQREITSLTRDLTSELQPCYMHACDHCSVIIHSKDLLMIHMFEIHGYYYLVNEDPRLLMQTTVLHAVSMGNNMGRICTKCQFCPKPPDALQKLIWHMMHTHRMKLWCPYDENGHQHYTCNSIHYFEQHLRAIHGVNKAVHVGKSCGYPNKLVSSETQKNVHPFKEENSHKETPKNSQGKSKSLTKNPTLGLQPCHTCRDCSVLFHKDKDLVIHMADIHNYYFLIAKEQRVSIQTTILHAVSMGTDVGASVKCQFCPESVDSIEKLLCHLIHLHKMKLWCPYDENEHYTCNNIQYFAQHLWSVHGVNKIPILVLGYVDHMEKVSKGSSENCEVSQGGPNTPARNANKVGHNNTLEEAKTCSTPANCEVSQGGPSTPVSNADQVSHSSNLDRVYSSCGNHEFWKGAPSTSTRNVNNASHDNVEKGGYYLRARKVDHGNNLENLLNPKGKASEVKRVGFRIVRVGFNSTRFNSFISTLHIK